MKKHDTTYVTNTYKEMKIKPNSPPYIIFKKYLDKAYVHITIDNSNYTPNPKFNDINQVLPYHIKINYLCGSWDLQKRIYNRKPNPESRSPKGLPRQLLCEMLEELLDRYKIDKDYIIVLDANPSYSSDNFLVKMYEKMGFEVAGRLCKTLEQYIKDGEDKDKYDEYVYSTETIMYSTVEKVLDWCNKKFL
jgi:hypothetical protein